MSFPTPLETSWEPSVYRPLAWNGTGWYYSGDYADANDNPGGIIPSSGSTWQDNYSPANVSITFTSIESWESYGGLTFYIGHALGACSYQKVMPDDIKSLGEHTINFDLTDITNNGGITVTDINYLGLYIGRGDGPTLNRSFTITDITFSGSGIPYAGPFWKDFVGCESR